MPTDGLIAVIKDHELSNLVAKLGKATGDFSEPLRRVADSLQTQIDLLFRSSKDPSGQAWKQLKHRRRRDKKKAKSGRKNKPLLDTAVLANSLTSDSEGSIRDIGKFTLRFGTELEYAATHNFGDSSRNIPQRQFLPDEDDFPKDWLDEIEEDLLEGFDFIL